MTNQEIYRNMVKKHDVSYSYSDDGGVYRKGLQEEREINEFGKKFLTEEERKSIWNEVIRERFSRPDQYLMV